MVVGILEVTFHIPLACSRKDKRQVVASLKERIRQRYNVSLSETEGQDSWQECTLAIAMVAMGQGAVERDFQRIVALIESQPSVSHTEYWIDYLA